MRWVQNLDLKNKLVFLAAVSGTMALLMACSGFIWHDVRLLRLAQLQELHSKAEMLAIAGASSVTHDQPEALKSLIVAVKEAPSIATVCLFDVYGEPIASHPAVSQSSNR